MENEGLILELFRRVKSLEDKVEKLEKVKNAKISNEPIANKISRVEARKYVMDKLVEKNTGHTAMIGNQKEGSGIVVIHDETKLKFKIKVFHSNNKRNDRFFGWHTVYQHQFINTKYDFYVFTVYYQQKIHSFIFSYDEFNDLILSKNVNKDLYHLYFEQDGDCFYETKDHEAEVGYDVTRNYNNWERL